MRWLAHRGGRTVRQNGGGREREAEASLTLAFASGRVAVASDPPGAEISVDGAAAGQGAGDAGTADGGA